MVEQRVYEYIEIDDSSEPPCDDNISLLSVVKNHTFEHGRRFHGYKQGKYGMPNDEQEQDRMDLCHHYFLQALNGKLYTAPIENKNPERILDVGTGTGIWCVDMGDAFPDAQIFGVDLSPIQPQWVPPNVSFEVDDIDEDWMWPENYFDYIHVRSMAAWLHDWPRLFEQAYRALKPGGYIELEDLMDFFSCDDGTVPDETFIRQWIRLGAEAITEKQGIPWLQCRDLFLELLEKTGYEDIREMANVKCPIGPWPAEKKLKELGMWSRQMKLDGCTAFILASFTRHLGWSPAQVEQFAEGCKKDLLNPKYHAYERFFCIIGRKPEAAGV